MEQRKNTLSMEKLLEKELKSTIDVMQNLQTFESQCLIRMNPEKTHKEGYKLHGIIEEVLLKKLASLGVYNRFFDSYHNMVFKKPITRDKTVVLIKFKRISKLKVKKKMTFTRWRAVMTHIETIGLAKDIVPKGTVYCEVEFDLIGPHPKRISQQEVQQLNFDFKGKL